MEGFYKYRTSRSVSPPKTPSYGAKKWILRSAMSSQLHSSMESTMENIEGLSGVSHKTGYVSPLRARTMKEYEHQITELQKENFNLKLRLYFLEEKMEKNFDGDTRQLHEVNIQLKIEVEQMHKELEQQRKLLQEARINEQKTQEKHEKEFLEWKTNLQQKELKDTDTVEKEAEVNISEMCKEAFGFECSPSQTDISESTQSDIEAKEKRLEDTVTTLQRLDKLQHEELGELRKMAQEKQSNLDNYVAKVKQFQEKQQFVTDNTCSKLPKEVMEKDSSDMFSQNTKMLLETEVANSKKQILKRDKILKGMTEIVFMREKEIERLNAALTEKESIEQLISTCANTINIAVENPSSFDKVNSAVREVAISLMKAKSMFDTNMTKQLPEYALKSLERNFVQWIFDLANNSKSCDKRNVEELRENGSAVGDSNVQSVLASMKEKDAVIQDLYCKVRKLELNHDPDKLAKLSEDVSSSEKHIKELEQTVKTLVAENSELKSSSGELKRSYDNIIFEKNDVLSSCNEMKKKITRLQQVL